MRLFWPTFDWRDLVPKVIAMGTTRGLRIRRIGETFFLEFLTLERIANAVTLENWKVSAFSKHEDARMAPAERTRQAYKDALEHLCDTNRRIAEQLRAESAGGGRGGARVVRASVAPGAAVHRIAA